MTFPTAAARPATVSADPIRDYLHRIGRTALLTADQEYELGERMAAGLRAEQRLSEIGTGATELGTAERRELTRAVRAGRAAKDHMIEANLRLVVSIAKRYPAPPGMSLLDLVQEGTLGLIRAVEKFDHQRGLKFSTYATWWIKQAVGRAIDDKSRAIRIPAHVAEILHRITRAQRTLGQRLGREATPEELATELELPAEKVREVLGHARDPISLHLQVGDDDTELGALIADQGPDPSTTVADASIRTQLGAVLATLAEREAQVLVLRYGLDGTEPRTLEQVGRMLGVSRERIRQIEAKSMAKLRKPASARALAGLLG
ncbi:sigma-70 family RNA polymerase sigma factor [Nocardia mexicana]|uniref:RNA polymerase sigma factor n=1 Tax=Nocardia mexicana TaxID=279262 RepID=A0A370HA31_9NOCA|nr:sigma-70 family RNA polymerase sigma factor [Nocardia mexicana]RDI53296.1 RNA polymerase primary sigma factor [Nocardia mexicana]